MARRRNTPALFELLRESNSTPKGQVGNPALREQIGAGTVENSAPRTPRPPDPQAKIKPNEPTKADHTRVASEAVVETKPALSKSKPVQAVSKAPTNLITQDPAPEPALLQEIPSFKARSLRKPAPIAAAKPESKPEVKDKPPAPASEKPVTPMDAKPPQSEPKSSSAPTSEAAHQSTAAEDAQHTPPGKITVSVSTLWMAFAGVMVLFVLTWVIAVQTGRKQSTDRLAAASSDAAKNALKDAGVTEPRIVDPLAIASDPEFVPPQPEPAEAPPKQTEPEPEPTNPQVVNQADDEQLAYIDRREPGRNYLHLAPLADPEEAMQLRAFLHENGIESFIRKRPKGDRNVYEIITLLGLPSKGFRTSTVKLEHQREIQRLGGLWFREHGGSIDYSRSNQWQWYKMPIPDTGS